MYILTLGVFFQLEFAKHKLDEVKTFDREHFWVPSGCIFAPLANTSKKKEMEMPNDMMDEEMKTY